MAIKKYTEHALDVLRQVKAGTPWLGREIAGRRRHLNWLEEQGLVRQLGETWQLTEAGEKLIKN
jgi:hypothetical protein